MSKKNNQQIRARMHTARVESEQPRCCHRCCCRPCCYRCRSCAERLAIPKRLVLSAAPALPLLTEEKEEAAKRAAKLEKKQQRLKVG